MQYQLPEEFEFLNFNRFDVHVKGHNLTHQQIKEAAIASDSSEKSNNALYRLLNKQLGIYYAFYKRDLTKAHKFLNLWILNVPDKNSIEYAEACNYLGYALAIDEKYAEPSLFDISLAIYDTLSKEESPSAEQYALEYAFALCFSATTIKRHALEIYQTNPTAARHMIDLARGSLQGAYAKQQANNANAIDLAESMLALAKLEYYNKNFEEAENFISQALQHWQTVYTDSGYIHPLQFATKDLHAKILLHLRNYQQAASVTLESIDWQLSFYNDENNLKIAESLLLLAEILEKNQRNTEALQALQKALKIKQQLSVELPEIVFIENKIRRITEVATREALEQEAELPIINNSFELDFNNAESHANAKTRFNELQLTIAKYQLVSQKLSSEPRYALAQLKYKLATFYLHVVYDNFDNERLDKAISYLNDAKKILNGTEYFWALNQLACAYQQKLAREDFSVQEKLYSVNMEVILHNDLPQATQEQSLLVAFAYCTAAQGMAAREKLDIAIHNYQKAINIYHRIGEHQSVQCLRARNVCASYLAKNKQLDFAAATYATIDGDWRNQENWECNQFAGRFYLGYARFLRDSMGQLANSLTQLQRAQNILRAANNLEYANELEPEIQDLRKRCTQAPIKVSTGPSKFNHPNTAQSNDKAPSIIPDYNS